MGSPGGGLDAEALERCSHRRPAFPAGGYNTKRPGSPECFGDPGLIHVSRVRIQLRGVSADNAFSRSGPSEPTDGHAGVATTTRPTPTAPAWVQAARAGRATDSARSRPACRRQRCAIRPIITRRTGVRKRAVPTRFPAPGAGRESVAGAGPPARQRPGSVGVLP